MLSADERILHLLNRFTPGATADLVAAVRDRGGEAWLDEQLAGGIEEPPALTDRLSEFESLELSPKEMAEKYDPRIPDGATEKERREIRRLAAIPGRETLGWVFLRAVYGAQHVRETMTDFFRNHFAVSIEKGAPMRFLLSDWERNVITCHALGNFGDLLEATAKHPAMLFFLDNYLSQRPPTGAELREIESRVKRRTGSEERAEAALDAARQRGLNENYARELLELHTLGVDNYYTQQDVTEVARCLTGWGIAKRMGGFKFNRDLHDPGEKTVLGQSASTGEDVLRLLRDHEGTAKFVSWKLCRFLVSDDPDAALVDRIAAVFRDSAGDLPRVLRAIATDEAFHAGFRAKFKRPWEFVVSAMRVTGAEISDPTEAIRSLTALNEPLYRCADPTGFYDQAEAWRDPGAMAARWTFAADLTAGRIRGVKVPFSFYSDLSDVEPARWRAVLAEKILPVAGLDPAVAERLDAMVASNADPSPRKHGPQIVTALLGSPDFQRQ